VCTCCFEIGSDCLFECRMKQETGGFSTNEKWAHRQAGASFAIIDKFNDDEKFPGRLRVLFFWDIIVVSLRQIPQVGSFHPKPAS
jgi:hypothetical protein